MVSSSLRSMFTMSQYCDITNIFLNDGDGYFNVLRL